MVTAKTILSSIGSIKKKVKDDTGSRKSQTEKRNIEKKAAQGRKERSIQKKKAIHSLTRKGKKGIKKNAIKKASMWTRRSAEAAWARRSTGGGRPRYHFLMRQPPQRRAHPLLVYLIHLPYVKPLI